MKIRVLRTGYNNAFLNMGVDEALMLSHNGKKEEITLRVYEWKPSAVSIGYFQSLNEEVDVEKCGQENVDIVRRLTGGGAVYHDKEVTYSFVCNEKLLNKNIIDSYKQICSGITNGLKLMGINSFFHPINDIIAGTKKISGNAQTRKNGRILQHGTVLMQVDVNKMFSLLKVSNEKIKYAMIETVKERVTSVGQLLDRTVSNEEVENALINGFKETFKGELIESQLTQEEMTLAEERAEQRFKSKKWLEMK